MDDRKSIKDRLDFQTIFTNRLTDGCRIWITLNIKPFSSGDVKSIYHRRKFFISVKYVHGKLSLFFSLKKLHSSRPKEVNYQVSDINQESKCKLVH